MSELELRVWSAGTTRRSALLLTVCVFASLVFLQELAIRAGVTAEASWLPAVVGTGLVLVAAVVGHLLTRTGRRVTPVPPGLVPHLAQLTARAGISRVPEFAVNPRALTTGAVTLGRIRRYRVVLDAGLVARRERDPARFAAVVLHELAHVHNRDVEVAQLTVALWRVTSLAVLLPYILVNLWGYLYGPDRAGALRDVELALAVSAVLYLVYAEVLRIRELYADRDAVLWGADPQVWAEPEEPHPDTVRELLVLLVRRLVGGTGTRLATLLRTHPTPYQRRLALNRPDSTAAASMVSDSFLSLVLPGAATFVLGLLSLRQTAPGGPTEWPGPLRALVYYSVAVVFVAVLAASPSHQYEIKPVRYVPSFPWDRRPAWAGTVFLGVILALLFVTDPIDLRSGESPKQLLWPLMPPPAAPTTWATPQSPAMVELGRDWERRGGFTAQTRLRKDLYALRDKLHATQPRHIDWGSFETDCAAVSRDVDALDALGRFPYPDGQQPWSILKNRSRAAVEVLCHHRYTTREFNPLLTAAEDIEQAQSAAWRLWDVLIHYLTDQ